jgi:hypothetical protein
MSCSDVQCARWCTDSSVVVLVAGLVVEEFAKVDGIILDRDIEHTADDPVDLRDGRFPRAAEDAVGRPIREEQVVVVARVGGPPAGGAET